MDFSKTSGATVTVVGIVTVFLALTLLFYVVGLLAKLLDSGARTAAAPESAPVAPPSTRDVEPQQDIFALVAAAAYAVHQARRVTVRSPQAATAWLRSGRLRQVGRSDGLR